MNKYAFLAALRDRLTGLPQEDIARSLDYYSESIDDRMEEGLSEEEATQAVGSIDEIAAQILAESALPCPADAAKQSKRPLLVWGILLLILGSPLWLTLLAAAAIILLAVFTVLWSVIASLYAVVISVAAGAAAGILCAIALLPVGQFAKAALCLGAGLICVGLTILFCLGSNQLAKGAAFISRQILRGVKACFVRQEGRK